MSYFNMDHADWVQSNITAIRRHADQWTASAKRRATNRTGWEGAPKSLLQWQCQAFDVLGIAGGGIYNAPINWNRVEWSDRALSLTWARSLATWDFRQLTLLVFGMHTARLRCEIDAAARGYFRFHISPRRPDGGMADRHPDLDEAVTAWNASIPKDHPLRAPRDTEQGNAA
jgi:hypothetical protein